MVQRIPVLPVLVKVRTHWLPLTLWLMICLGLHTGSDFSRAFDDLLNPSRGNNLFGAIRFFLPFIAVIIGLLILAAKVKLSTPGSIPRLLLGPLGLMTLYGLIGMGSLFISPDKSMALRYCILYVSVAVVLLAIASGDRPLENIVQVLRLNWALLVLAFCILFGFSVMYMELSSETFEPFKLWTCQLGGSWYITTEGLMRSTGVGRFAALAALIAFSFVWRGNLRVIWLIIFVLAFFLLWSTGARTSMVALAAGLAVSFWLNTSGKLVMIMGATLLFISLITWPMGLPQDFLRGCVLKRFDPAGVAYLNIKSPATNLVISETLTTSSSQLSVNHHRDGNEIDSEILANVKQDHDIPRIPTIVPLSSDPTAGLGIGRDSPDIKSSNTPHSMKQPFTSGIDKNDDMAKVIPAESQASNIGSGVESGQHSELSDRVESMHVESTNPMTVTSPRETFEQLESIKAASQSSSVTLNGNSVTYPETRADSSSDVLYESNRTRDDDSNSVSNIGTRDSPKSFEKTEVGFASLDHQNPATMTYIDETGFLKLNGRTAIWSSGWEFIKLSPWFGYGFHADRLVLGTHMHNAIMHALIQTGFVGLVPFAIALAWCWILTIKVLKIRKALSNNHDLLIIQTASIITFLSVRMFAESTGAFFSIDWLVLAPYLLFIQLQYTNSSSRRGDL